VLQALGKMNRGTAPERHALFHQWDARGPGRVLLSALNVLKTAEAIVSQAERPGGLHYLVFKTDKLAESVNVARRRPRLKLEWC
jgi:hypothetical protein